MRAVFELLNLLSNDYGAFCRNFFVHSIMEKVSMYISPTKLIFSYLKTPVRRPNQCNFIFILDPILTVQLLRLEDIKQKDRQRALRPAPFQLLCMQFC